MATLLKSVFACKVLSSTVTMVTDAMSFSKKWGVGSKKGKYITEQITDGWKMRQKFMGQAGGKNFTKVVIRLADDA